MLSSQEYAKQKMLLNQRALQLLDIAKAIGPNGHRASSRKGRLQYNKFKQAVYFLEKDWEKVKVAYKQRGIRRRARTTYSPTYPWAVLDPFLG